MSAHKDKDGPGDQAEIERKLVVITKRAGKTYAFDEAHDPSRPVDWFFQESDEGPVLFVIFYTQACRWSLCTGCSLPSVGSQRHVPWNRIMAQIDWLFAQPEVQARKTSLRKIIVSNNGSVLDEKTFSSTALMHLMIQLNLQFPALEAVSFETRVEYVDLSELDFLARAAHEGATPTEIELAIGFEAFDDHIRNKVFLKGFSLHEFEELAERVGHRRFRLKCYFMQKPVVNMSDDDAVADIKKGIDYLSEMADKHSVPINMHLNPTYAARDTPLGQAFVLGKYSPPRLADVARAVLHGQGQRITIFVGLNDEGLAVEGGSFVREGDEPLIAALEAFNRTQDYQALAKFLAAASPASA